MTRRAALLFVVLVWVAALSFSARAGSPAITGAAATTAWTPVAGGEFRRLLSQPMTTVVGRTWTAEAAGAVSAAEVSSFVAARGAMSVSSAVSISAAEAAAVVGRCLLQPVCVAATAAAAIAYEHYRVKPAASVTNPTAPSPSDVVQWDPGLPPADVSCMGYANAGLGLKCLSAQAFCNTLKAGYESGYYVTGGSVAASGSGADTTCNFYRGNGDLYASTTIGAPQPDTNTACVPNSITLNGVSVPNEVGFDGKCRTGAYSQTLIVAALSAMVAAAPFLGSDGKSHPLWKEAVKESVETGKQSATGAITTTGPATQTGTGTSTTTTGPTGTTTTMTTPTTNYMYDGDTITYNNTFVTVTNNGGDTTTTTGDGDPTKPEDPCAANPSRAGCAKLGDPTTDKPVWTQKPVTYATEDFGFAGSCPAPWTLPLRGGASVEYKYDGLCSMGPQLRGWILVLTAFSCLFAIVSQTTKS
ncbi:MAG: hypothetical protein ABIR79_16495 [Candidatus Binatia bacterium]